MKNYQALTVYKEQDQIVSRLKERQLTDISAGEVLIRAAYSSVNYKDALAVTGRGKIIRTFPLVAGIDVSGVIVQSKDKRFKEGDSVLVTGYQFGVATDGGYAEYVTVTADWVVRLPQTMSLYDAMALGTAGFTVALCALRLEQIGQRPELGPLVITGATGGVGSLAVDIMSNQGYEIVALTGKRDRHPFLNRLGAQHILARNHIAMDGNGLEKGQWGGAIDNVGGDILAWLTRTVKPWGAIASVGLAGGAALNTTVMPFILRGVSLLGITSSGCPAHYRKELWQRLATDLAPKQLAQIVTNTVTLDELPAVFDAMLAGHSVGRTVVKISDIE